MGLAARHFWLDERDDVHRVATRKWQRIMDGEQSVPAFAGQRMVIVEAIVDVDRRDVLGVARLTAWRCAFNDRGYVDSERADARMRLALESLEFEHPLGQPANVRSLAPRIAERRLGKEFHVTLSAAQRDAVLRAIWKQ